VKSENKFPFEKWAGGLSTVCPTVRTIYPKLFCSHKFISHNHYAGGIFTVYILGRSLCFVSIIKVGCFCCAFDFEGIVNFLYLFFNRYIRDCRVVILKFTISMFAKFLSTIKRLFSILTYCSFI